jgi:bifunctional non-homologous end joining protein LigD
VSSPAMDTIGLIRAAANLRCQSAILDGEAIVQNGNGASDFEALSSALQRQPHSIILYAFDLLHLDGKDLRQQTLMERRANLKHLVGADDQSRIQFSDEFDGDGDALFKACAEQGLEGVVSKHALAPYRSGRSRTWHKTKCFAESTFVVIGTDQDRKTGALRALLTRTVRARVTLEQHSWLLVVKTALDFSLSLSVSPRHGQHLSRHG